MINTFSHFIDDGCICGLTASSIIRLKVFRCEEDSGPSSPPFSLAIVIKTLGQPIRKNPLSVSRRVCASVANRIGRVGNGHREQKQTE